MRKTLIKMLHVFTTVKGIALVPTSVQNVKFTDNPNFTTLLGHVYVLFYSCIFETMNVLVIVPKHSLNESVV